MKSLLYPQNIGSMHKKRVSPWQLCPQWAQSCWKGSTGLFPRRMTSRWPNYVQSQHYFLLIFIWIQMWVEELGKYSNRNVYRNKESVIYLFLNCGYNFTVFSNHMKYLYLFFCTAAPRKTNPTPSPPKILIQSRAEFKVSHKIQSIQVNCIKTNKPSPITKKQGIINKTSPPTMFPNDCLPQVDHSEITVSRQV